jgi:hypothetical protein
MHGIIVQYICLTLRLQKGVLALLRVELKRDYTGARIIHEVAISRVRQAWFQKYCLNILAP